MPPIVSPADILFFRNTTEIKAIKKYNLKVPFGTVTWGDALPFMTKDFAAISIGTV